MPNPSSFVEHVVDLFTPLCPLEARRMFGGHGLFIGGVMFGLLDDGELFLKTDDQCEPQFLAAGGRRWVYASRKGPMESRYLTPPPEAMDAPEQMRPWCELSIAAAQRIEAAKRQGKKVSFVKPRALAKTVGKAKAAVKQAISKSKARPGAKSKAGGAKKAGPKRA